MRRILAAGMMLAMLLSGCARTALVPDGTQASGKAVLPTAGTESAAETEKPDQEENTEHPTASAPVPSGPETTEQAEEEETVLKMTINGKPVTVTWAENAAAEGLKEKAGTGEITVRTSRYGGFEQVGSLGFSLPRQDVQTVTGPGDIMLYSGNQIVVFFGENSWAYTVLGKIEGMSERELRDLLDREECELVLTVE